MQLARQSITSLADIPSRTVNEENHLEQEWCLPQRTGPRRYTSTLQSLFWQYEQLMERIDNASSCAKRRYENAKLLCGESLVCTRNENEQLLEKVPNSAEKPKKTTSKESRGQLRLVRHYALQRSLLHAMCLSLVYSWRSVLGCVRAVSDAPVPTPLSTVTNTQTENLQCSVSAHIYSENCYRVLHETCRDCTDVVMQELIHKCQKWINTIESVPSVRSLHEQTRVEILDYLEKHVIDRLCICRALIADAWIKLLDHCDHRRIEKEIGAEDEKAEKQDEDRSGALQILRKLTATVDGGTSVALFSRNSQPPGRLIDVSLPILNVLSLSQSNSLPVEVEERRLLDALKAIGGSGTRNICNKTY